MLQWPNYHILMSVTKDKKMSNCPKSGYLSLERSQFHKH
jgi:hypothetical protein